MILSNEDLRRLQLLQLKILKEVHKICEEHGIKYFLSDGTLIGAVRHKGFIPWDDDLDIGMLRDEFEKFCAICKTELPNEYFFQTMETDPGYGCVFGKMILNGTVYIEAITEKTNKKSGVCIDIFPYDCIPNERYKQVIQFVLVKFVHRAYVLKTRYKANWTGSILKFFVTLCAFLFSFLPLSTLYTFLHHTITKYSWLAKENTCLVTKFGGNFWKNQNDIENFRLLMLTAFEDGMFYIPQNYDVVLSNLYGDYMTLPPIEKRETTHKIIEFDF